MTQTLDTTKPLTEAERRQVQTYAEFLISRRCSNVGPETSGGSNVDALVGLCKGMGGDKSDKELIREAWDEMVAKYD